MEATKDGTNTKTKFRKTVKKLQKSRRNRTGRNTQTA